MTQTQQHNVPTLRFPEFSGEWGLVVLGEVANFRRGSFPQPYGLPKWYDDENGHPFVQVFDVGKNLRLKPKTKRQISELATEKSVFAPKNSIVLTIQGSIGRIAITQYDAYVDRTLLIFQSFTIPVDEQFFAQVIYLLFEKERRLAPGGTIKTITKEVLSHFKFRNPPLAEQQKIASFLSSVDGKIEQLGKKKALLEQYKKGMMQKLFSQELRFKDAQGNDFPNWEEKRLGDFCDSLSGCPVAGDDIHEEDTGLPLLRGINITEGKIRHSQKMDRFHGGQVNGGEKFLLRNGDVVIGMDGSKVGKNVAVITKDDAGSFLIQRVTRLRKNSDNKPQYVYFHIISDRFRRYVDTVNTSSGIPHISLKQINDFNISMPHPDEQQKIADFLSSIDQKINLVSTELNHAKTFKKGLLQQMFI